MIYERMILMDFGEKLQKLRKQKGMTQEQLASCLYVSRTAVSKWESGRGLPEIDSIKKIAQLFSVTIDQLLSTDEVLTIVDNEKKQSEKCFQNNVFGFMDFMCLFLFFFPFFAKRTGGMISAVSLIQLCNDVGLLQILYCILVAILTLTGVIELAFNNINKTFSDKYLKMFSIVVNAFALILFVVTLQPYASVFLFVFFGLKVLMLFKLR